MKLEGVWFYHRVSQGYHFTIAMWSGVIITCIAFGLPVVFAIVLVRAASHYKRDQVRTDNFLVRTFLTAIPLALALYFN